VSEVTVNIDAESIDYGIRRAFFGTGLAYEMQEAITSRLDKIITLLERLPAPPPPDPPGSGSEAEYMDSVRNL